MVDAHAQPQHIVALAVYYFSFMVGETTHRLGRQQYPSFYPSVRVMNCELELQAGGRRSPQIPIDPRVPRIPFAANTMPYGEQGKVAELRQELTMGGKKDKNHSAKKIALKKIVANMTMSNNDMVALFPDIISCMQIQSLEIKKM